MLILPPNYPKQDPKRPTIFLAGPIQGARDWQQEAIDYIQTHAPELAVASPRKNRLGEKFVYQEQVDWESHYLKQAAKNGVIIFYLANEAKHYPERAYAQTTRFELAEWRTKQLYGPYQDCKIVIGIESKFSGARYIRHRLGQENPKIPILDNLADVCQKAIDACQTARE